MWLLAGLGNPGAEYQNTRHNIGFAALEKISDLYSFADLKSGHKGLWAKGLIGSTEVIILKPMTFMNLSGNSVSSIASYFKIIPERIVVIADEMSLKIGRIKLKIGGGNAGHNGLKSVEEYIGNNFWRLRIGIDHPGDKNLVTPHVLGKINEEEQQVFENVLKTISEELPHIFTDNPDNFATKVALKLNPSIASPQQP